MDILTVFLHTLVLHLSKVSKDRRDNGSPEIFLSRYTVLPRDPTLGVENSWSCRNLITTERGLIEPWPRAPRIVASHTLNESRLPSPGYITATHQSFVVFQGSSQNHMPVRGASWTDNDRTPGSRGFRLAGAYARSS